MKQILHLLRRPSAEGGSSTWAPHHWVVDLGAGVPRLIDHGAPPLTSGTITFEQLHALICAADLVVTW